MPKLFYLVVDDRGQSMHTIYFSFDKAKKYIQNVKKNEREMVKVFGIEEGIKFVVDDIEEYCDIIDIIDIIDV